MEGEGGVQGVGEVDEVSCFWAGVEGSISSMLRSLFLVGVFGVVLVGRISRDLKNVIEENCRQEKPRSGLGKKA